MDLKLFLSPVSEQLYSGVTSVSSFYKNINVNDESMPDYKDQDIALIGIQDDRGANQPNGFATAADTIRKKLYKLKRGFGRYHILDLGNLANGISIDETYKRMKEVSEFLISKNVLPLFFGSSHDMDYGQYMAY